jgi:hypothetical protein
MDDDQLYGQWPGDKDALAPATGCIFATVCMLLVIAFFVSVLVHLL